MTEDEDPFDSADDDYEECDSPLIDPSQHVI